MLLRVPKVLEHYDDRPHLCLSYTIVKICQACKTSPSMFNSPQCWTKGDVYIEHDTVQPTKISEVSRGRTIVVVYSYEAVSVLPRYLILSICGRERGCLMIHGMSAGRHDLKIVAAVSFCMV